MMKLDLLYISKNFEESARDAFAKSVSRNQPDQQKYVIALIMPKTK